MPRYHDKNNEPLKAGDVCRYMPDSFDALMNTNIEDYEGDPCVISSLGPSQIVAFVKFEGDPRSYKVNTSALVKEDEGPTDTTDEKA